MEVGYPEAGAVPVLTSVLLVIRSEPSGAVAGQEQSSA